MYRYLTGTGAMQVQVPCRYGCHTGTGAIQVMVHYRYRCLAGTGVIQVQVPYRYRCHTGTGALQAQVPCRYRCLAGTASHAVRKCPAAVQIKSNQQNSATSAPCAVVLLQHNFAFWLYECVSCCIAVGFWDCTCERAKYSKVRSVFWPYIGCAVQFVLTCVSLIVLHKVHSDCHVCRTQPSVCLSVVDILLATEPCRIFLKSGRAIVCRMWISMDHYGSILSFL